MYPDGFKYTKEHEWIQVEGDLGRIGITHYAQKQLGDVVYLQLPAVGAKLGPMEVFGTIESVKAVSELFSPVSGEVVEVNGVLDGKPETVNEDPHGRGWMIVLRLADPSEQENLLSASDYQAFVEREAGA